IARTPRVPIASESPASVDLQPFGPSRKRDLTRFAGAGREPRTRAAYSQIRPPSETRNQLVNKMQDKSGNAAALATALVSFVGEIATGFSSSSHGNRLIQEV